MESGANGEDSTRKRRKCSSSSQGAEVCSIDRISELPDSLIHYILSFLPTKSAFRTSFLSKSWKLHWTRVSAFDFDEDLWPVDQNMDFVGFVDMALVYHTYEPIRKLRLQWKSPNVRSSNLFIWILIAVSRNVQALDLAALVRRSLTESIEFYLPNATYSCRTLEVLRLQGPFLVSLSDVEVCLPKLSVLELIEVRYESDESLPELISGCPVLRYLRIESLGYRDNMAICNISSASLKRLYISFHGWRSPRFVEDGRDMKLEIYAPALEKLEIIDEMSSQISIRGMPELSDATLDVLCSTSREDSAHHNMIIGLLQAFQRAKVMALFENTMRAIAKATNRLSTNFERLNLLAIRFDSPRWNCLVEVIEYCVNLQTLYVEYCGESDGVYWTDPVGVPRCLSSSLKIIAFKSFDGLEVEMALLKFILHHGAGMERVYLWFCEYDPSDSERRHEILNRVLKLPKQSPTCEIVEWRPSLRRRLTT